MLSCWAGLDCKIKSNLAVIWFMHEVTDGPRMSRHSILCYIDGVFFCFWSSVACRVVILAGCGGCLGGLFVQCSLTSKLHVFFMPDKTSEMGFPHSWNFTCFHMLYLICHVHSLIINEVMEMYSCIELTPSTKLMSCEGWGYILNVTYITTGLYWQCNINVLKVVHTTMFEILVGVENASL